MKRFMWLVGVMLLAIVLLFAISCGGEEEEAATPTSPAPTATPEEEAAKPAAGWGDIPIYPGGESVQEWSMTIPGATAGEEYEKVEWRYYTTKDAVAKVADFYNGEMPRKGWQELMWMTATEDLAWGIYQKGEGASGAGIWIMRQEDENVTGIGLWLGLGK